MAETLKILCVEDDADILFVTLLSLRQDSDIVVAGADNAGLALDILRGVGGQVDCILLDVRMPGMSGIEMLSKLRTDPPHGKTPVIFLTADLRSHDLSGYGDLRIAGVIAKPYNPMTLAGDVRAILARARQLDALN